MRRRLGWALALTALGSVVVMAILSVGLLRRVAVANARADLQRVADALAGDPSLGEQTLGLPAIRRVLAIDGDLAAIVGPRGGTRGDGAAIASALDLGPLLSGARIEGTVRSGGEQYVYVGVPVNVPGRALARGVVMARPVRLARSVAGGVIVRIVLAALIAVGAAVAASAVIARRLVKPVDDLAVAAQRIAQGHLGETVDVPADHEIGDLAVAFNRMSVELGEAQRREREFLASVSHELRTPITAIKGYAEAIADGAVHGEQGRAEAVAIIQTEAGRLERMVSDVMDLARVGQKEFALDVRPVDLSATIRDAVAGLGATAGDVTLTCDAPDRVTVETDADRVSQVVGNLAQNALRVTPPGGSVVVRLRPENGGALIEVADTGPGIAPQDVPHVFERSYLWRASKADRPVGTGLGLAIVRELVARLGGTVEVRSVVGEGSVFSVHLPAHA